MLLCPGHQSQSKNSKAQNKSDDRQNRWNGICILVLIIRRKRTDRRHGRSSCGRRCWSTKLLGCLKLHRRLRKCLSRGSRSRRSCSTWRWRSVQRNGRSGSRSTWRRRSRLQWNGRSWSRRHRSTTRRSGRRSRSTSSRCWNWWLRWLRCFVAHSTRLMVNLGSGFNHCVVRLNKITTDTVKHPSLKNEAFFNASPILGPKKGQSCSSTGGAVGNWAT